MAVKMVSPLKRLNLLYKYLISYIIILVIPLAILGGILYNNSVIVLQKEIEDLEISKITKVRQLVDNQFIELEKIAVKILFDRQMAPYVVKKNDYYSKLTSESLMRYKLNSMLADELFLYFRGDGSIISSGGKMSVNTLSNVFFSFDGEEYGRFFKRLNSAELPIIIGTGDPIYNKNNRGKYLLYLYPTMLQDDIQSAIVIFAIHKQTLVKYIENALGELNGFLYIYKDGENRREEVVSIGNNMNITSVQLENILENAVESTICNTTINEQDYSVIKVMSNSNRWQYVSIIPRVALLKRVFNTRSQIFEAILLVIAIGVLVAALLSMINYIPIRKLNNKIKDSLVRIDHKTYKNEIEEIESEIIYTIEKNKSLTKQINYQQLLVKDQILLMILKGELKDVANPSELLTSCCITLNEGYSRVMVISIGNLERRKATYSDISFWLDATLHARIGSGSYFFLELMHNEIAIIINMKECETNRDFFCSLSEEILAVFIRQLNMSISIGAGKSYDNIMCIKDSYLEALSALDYQMIKGGGQVTLFEDMISSRNDRYWYPVEELINLAQSLKQGNIHAFNDIMDDIVINIKSRKLTFGMTQSVCFGIINTIINLVNEINIDGFSDEFEELAKFKTLNDLKARLNGAAARICKYVNDARGSSNQKLKEAIIGYIDREYKNSTLCLETVAGEFGLSPGYLSRFFRDQTGLKFIDYVKHLRISEAKKLLAETEIVIKDIVKKVGYMDVANFTRTFRIEEGITPGDYRKLHFQH